VLLVGLRGHDAVLQSLEPNAHVLLPDDVYYNTIKLARDGFGGWGLRVSCVDMTNLAQVENAISKQTRVVWIESPSNPLLRVADIAAISRLAKDAGACAPENLLRLSVGLEHADDLIEDLEGALR